MRGHTSGFCVPTFVVDAPGGGGKIPVGPNYVVSQSPDKIILRNYEGVISSYIEPKNYTQGRCVLDKKQDITKIASLVQEDKIATIKPKKLERKLRKKIH